MLPFVWLVGVCFVGVCFVADVGVGMVFGVRFLLDIVVWQDVVFVGEDCDDRTSTVSFGERKYCTKEYDRTSRNLGTTMSVN